jgi:DNA-3-methyladenine glycosylase I
VIRNRAKVAAVVANARVLIDLHAAGSGLRAITDEVLSADVAAADAEHVGAPRRRRVDVPAHTPASGALARRLRAHGWRFVGPTTAYAYLQAAGWVDDHLVGCHARGSADATDHAARLR